MYIFLALAALLGAQEVPGARTKPSVKVASIRPEKTEVKAGETVNVAFELEIPERWHIYPAGKKPIFGNPTKFTFEGAETAGRVEEPAPKIHKDEILEYDYHEGKVVLTVPLRLTGAPAPGPFELKGKIEYQICDPEKCVDNFTPFSFGLKVLEGRVEPAPAAQDDFAKYGLLGLVLLGMLGGLISLIMPCTYPLIPITLTYFVKQAAGSRTHGLVLSSLYSSGIILTFTGLGFLMSVLLGPGGARLFAADPWVNLVVGVLFLWFTGSLFGWYEIQLPFGLGQKLAGGGMRKGAGGAFILGLLFAVVTFTCTIPIAATILTFAAGQHRFAAFLAMLAYSVTMALPFFVMGLFPALIKEVPKSGGWLTTVKVSMAWVELALAIMYFAKADQTWGFGVLPRALVVGVWVGACLAVVLYLFRFFRARPTGTRVLFSLVFAAFGAYMGVYGFGGKSLGALEIIVPQPPIHGTTMPKAMAEARRLRKPLFIEFTGVN